MSVADDKRQAALDRRRAIRQCHLCDDYGWLKGSDGFAVEPARKCAHREPTLWEGPRSL